MARMKAHAGRAQGADHRFNFRQFRHGDTFRAQDTGGSA